MVITTEGGNVEVDELNRIKNMVDNQFSGVQNKSKTMVLTGGMKVSKDFILSHKDMDFIEGIKWDMEKIMAVFKVPKSMLGMGDGVNVGNVKAFETIFSKNVIEPLALQISEELEKQLFNNEVDMYFDNVIPKDEDQIRNNYLIGAITRNEMRMEL